MKIIVDAMGGDNAPSEIVKGALLAQKEFGVDILMVGKTEEILKCLESEGISGLPKGIEITNANDVISNEDDPASAVRFKKDASMSVALRLLKEGAGDAMVSAGSTGALLSGATLMVKRIRGIRRAALAPALPTAGGGMILIDCGANCDCTPEYLLQFAYMGSYYAKIALGKSNPRVALLNIGTEETKGRELQKEAYALLKQAGEKGGINFIGNIEGREAMTGDCDVLVCDGFTGNIFLKTAEGTALWVTRMMKELFMQNAKTKMAGLLVKGSLSDFKKRFDYAEIGGTALLGISKPIAKAHGSSKAYGLRSTIKQLIHFTEAGIIQNVQDHIDEMKISLPESEENS